MSGVNGSRVSRDLRLWKSAYDLTQLVRHVRDSAVPQGWGQALRKRFSERLDAHPPTGHGVLELDAAAFARPSSEIVRQGRPVVFRGAARAWACSERWSIPWLAETFGDDIVLDSDRSTLRYLKHMLSGNLKGAPDYVRFYSLVQRHSELLADIDLPGILRFAGPRSVEQGFQCFIGNKQASTTYLHCANDSNLFIQIAGEKKWRLIGPEYTPIIDPPPVRAEYRTIDHHRAFFDPFNPDYQAFPEFRSVPIDEVTLHAGDVFYNPPYVWHAVRNSSDDSFALAYRWLSPETCLRSQPLYFLMDLTANDPPVWKSMRDARRDFSLVFIEQSPNIKRSRLFSTYRDQVEKGFRDYNCAMREARRALKRFRSS